MGKKYKIKMSFGFSTSQPNYANLLYLAPDIVISSFYIKMYCQLNESIL